MKITRETLKKIIMEEMEKLGERAIEMGSFQAEPVGDVNVSTSGRFMVDVEMDGGTATISGKVDRDVLEMLKEMGKIRPVG